MYVELEGVTWFSENDRFVSGFGSIQSIVRYKFTENEGFVAEQSSVKYSRF